MENSNNKIELILSNGYVYKSGFDSKESMEEYLLQLYNKDRFCKTMHNGELIIINKDHIVMIRAF